MRQFYSYLSGFAATNVYVVRPGDCLWAIAQRYYGDGSLWPLLYAANADKVYNPNLIYPGEVLRLP
ncbi:MAG TPA: LysM peptidoglycan-binding domain-containing protein [Dehalococcoidia bacterium]|nr:LysM peptidoglycan-binding domain-containing protein [Dehalococcoidia bacterium]